VLLPAARHLRSEEEEEREAATGKKRRELRTERERKREREREKQRCRAVVHYVVPRRVCSTASKRVGILASRKKEEIRKYIFF